MASLDNFEEFVREKVTVEKCTHQQVSDELKSSFPGERGFSLRSVERFCREKGIKKMSNIDDQQLDDVVSDAVLQVKIRCCPKLYFSYVATSNRSVIIFLN